MMRTECPRCGEPVLIPTTDGPCVVECPWCKEQYELSELVDMLPPSVRIVSSAGTDSGFASAAVVPQASEPAFGNELSDFMSRDSDAEDLNDAFVQTTDSELSAVASRPSPRRKQSNPLIGIIKIAAGGVAGIFIAMMILQVIGRAPDLGIWPFRGAGSPMWGVLMSDSQSTPRRRAVAPAMRRGDATDASRRSSSESPKRLDGRELALPNLDEFKTEADKPQVNKTGIDETLARLLASTDDYFEKADSLSATERDETAAKLMQLLRKIAEGAADQEALSLDQQTILDTFAIRVSDEIPLLRAMISSEVSAPKNEASDSQSSAAVVRIGRIEESDDGLVLRGKEVDSEREKLTFPDALETPQTGKVVLLLGKQVEDGLVVNYVRAF